ncbi:MAG: DNA translocase FtsK 4TM domain-containing protein [Lachnospiraceae bacterium]|nr:DNA translocase FtsK 4TM domain-containing protein [Lachnospiraceae bacterium]
MSTGSTKRKNNSSSRNSGRKTTSGTRKRISNGSTSKRNVKSRASATGNKADEGLINEISLIVIIAFSALLLLSNLGIVGSLGDFISGVLYGLFGIVSFLVPIALVMAAFFYVSNKGLTITTVKIWAGVVLLIVLCALAQMLFPPKNGVINRITDYYTVCSGVKRGGGIIGGALSSVLTKGIGTIGTYIILIVLLIISGILITERSFLAGVRNGSLTLYDNARNDIERLRERRENERPLKEEQRRLRNEEKEARRIEEELIRKQKVEERNERLRIKEEERLKRKLEAEKVREENLRQREENLLRVDKKVSGVMMDTTLKKEDNINENDHLSSKEDMHEIIYDNPDETHKAVHNVSVQEDSLSVKIYDSDIKELHYNEPVNVNHLEYEHVKNEHLISVDTDGSEIYRKDSQVRELRADTPVKSYNTSELESAIINETVHLSDERDYDRSLINNGLNGDYIQERIYSQPEGEEKIREGSLYNEDIKEEKISGKQEFGYSDTTVEAYEMPSVSIDESVYNDPEKNRVTKVNAGNGDKNKKAVREFRFPPVSMLKAGKKDSQGDSKLLLDNKAIRLQETLKEFGVGVTMQGYTQGPAITRFEMKPDTGVKVSKVLNLSDDIMLSMAAKNVRIEAPIPGKSLIGIELPNEEISAVMFRDLIESKEFRESESKLSFAVGKGLSGETVVADIGKMPHLLIAGATGSGKSVCINTLIMSILYKARPDEVKLIMVDPKVVELSVYNGIPHLMVPVVTDPKQAAEALKWGVVEMDDRYNKFAEFGVRDLNGYNKKVKSMSNLPEEDKYKVLPRIVIIVDELADLMMVASKEVEESICRIAQKARAAGIHLVIATQRPSVDVVTGLIKANMPSRIAFSVSSSVDSRTILDMVGAEKLLGKGDMLFYPQGYTKPARVQGPFVSDQEVSDVVDFLKEHTGGDGYDEEIAQKIKNASSGTGAPSEAGGGSSVAANGNDELFVEAAKAIIDKNKASIGMLQRLFKIGFNRAARIMDQLAEAGVVGEEEGTKPRKVLMSMEQLEQYIEDYI